MDRIYSVSDDCEFIPGNYVYVSEKSLTPRINIFGDYICGNITYEEALKYINEDQPRVVCIDLYNTILSADENKLHLLNVFSEAINNIINVKWCGSGLIFGNINSSISYIKIYDIFKNYLNIDLNLDDLYDKKMDDMQFGVDMKAYFKSNNSNNSMDNTVEELNEFIKYYLENNPEYVASESLLHYIFYTLSTDLLELVAERGFDKNIIYDGFNALLSTKPSVNVGTNISDFQMYQPVRQFRFNLYNWDKLHIFLQCLNNNIVDLKKISTVYILSYIREFPQIVDFFIDNGIEIDHKFFETIEFSHYIPNLSESIKAASKISSNTDVVLKILFGTLAFQRVR